MLAKNETGFATIAYDQQRHRDGFYMAVIAVQGRYNLFADGTVRLSEKMLKIKSGHEHQGCQLIGWG